NMVHWIRPGIVKLDWSKSDTARAISSTYNIDKAYGSTSHGTDLYAANGFISLGSAHTTQYTGEDSSTNALTTNKLISIGNLNGQIFPIQLGREFSYRATYLAATRQGGKDYSSESTTEHLCKVASQYEAKRFHDALSGVAYLVVCD